VVETRRLSGSGRRNIMWWKRCTFKEGNAMEGMRQLWGGGNIAKRCDNG